MSQSVYLNQNVLAEPLFNQWYAWPYLIPPVCAAMYVANAHIKCWSRSWPPLRCMSPRSRTRPCSAVPSSTTARNRVGEVRELLQATTAELSPLMELAGAVKELEEMLAVQD